MKPPAIDIKNLTDWRTDDLRKVIKSAIDTYVERVASVPGWQNWHVTVSPRRRHHSISGYGWYNSRKFSLHVGNTIMTDATGRKCENKIDVVQMWLVAVHEIDHCRGLKHGEMPRYRESIMPEAVRSFVVRPRAIPVKHKPTRDDKIAAIDARIKKLETKRKRIEAALKRARRERTYHERALKRAASTATSTERANS